MMAVCLFLVWAREEVQKFRARAKVREVGRL